MAQKPHLQLKELGSKLETLPSSKDALVKLLKQATPCLAELDQSPSTSTLESMKPFFNAIVKPELLKHQDRDVKLLVATCVCEITRITAPEAPYSDAILKDIFYLIVGTFRGLSDTNGPSFGRRVVILETLAKYRSCVVMLDLECNDLVNEMFSIFFAVARDDHPESVLSSMETIMVVLLEESEDVREDLLSILLSKLGREKKAVNTAARRLAMNVIQQCVGKLEPSIKQFLLSLMSGDSKPVNNQVEYHGVIYDLYCCAPQILSGVLPYVTGELLTDQLETRLKAMNLVGDIISLPGSSIPEAFQPIFSEFLKRLTDRVVDVRMSVLEHVKNCLLLNPFRAEAPQIISSLCERLLDFDENVRKQVVAVICDVACHALNAVPLETVKLVSERLRDKSLLVKKYTMERLAEVYRVVCEKNSDTVNPNEYNWIPGKILRCFYDKDFRSDIIESVLCGSLFPLEFSVSVIAKHWIGIFSGFDRVEVKALEKILEQKQRLQQEMQKYLSLRQMSQDKDIPEVQKKILFCFRVMSRSFADPVKAEESFLILDQLKDANIWKILTNLVDPNTSFHQARAYRDDLLKILGEKHRLFEFLNTFSVKGSYLLFNKEHVKTILQETTVQKSAEKAQHTQSCMNILVIIARFSPLLLRGSEEELVKLLKDNNDTIKEGVLNAVAKAGGTIREQLAVTSSSVDLILERLCLEGSRRQAKYAVHALAAITKDDGLKSLSVLYKKLVDMLEDTTHLPAVLQSLGCIAQTAMPVYVTREKEIEEFILNKILKSDSKEDNLKTSWDGQSDLCMLKIYGIKTFVKSYLPVKDAHVRPDIDRILDILRNILLYGEISKDIKSSSVDKAHLKLACAKAVLRLSRLWDHRIPVDLFHLTLRVSEVSFPQARKFLLSKIHQYIKDRLLDAKYACAFLLNIFGTKPNKFAEDKQNLADIIQMHQQLKARQLSAQSDANSLATYPEYILPYLVHTLAHNSCPSVDDCKEFGAYDDIYRQFHLILSMLLQRDEDVKSEVTTDKEKEIISTITCIFLSIKHSEDVVDTSKSKNSHALCDLGLAITKRLVQKDVDLLGLSHLVSLPPMLYKASEKEGDDTGVTEVKTWLADESALTHFESLELEMVHSQSAENEASKDDEIDGNEIPLRKMLKHIKSQGTGGKKVKRNKSVPAETKKAENDFDTVNMVRQINGDNLKTSSNLEASNGHGHSLSKKSLKDLDSATGKKRKARHTFLLRPVYKRRKVSAIRDFPDGCGPSASRIEEVSNINIADCGSVNGTIVEVKNGEHLAGVKTCENDGWHSEPNNLLYTETLGVTVDSGLNKDNPMVSSYHVDGSTAEDRLEIGTLSQTADRGYTAEDKPGMMTISQTSDCGLNQESPVDSSHRVDGHIAEGEAAKVTLGLNQENPVVSSHQVDGSTPEDNPAKVKLGQTKDCSLNLENSEVSSHQVNGSIAEDELTKVTIVERTTDCGLNKENLVVSCRPVDGPTAEDKPAKVPSLDPETLNTEFARTSNTGKCDSSYELNSSSPAGEIAVPGDSKHLLSNANISAPSACMVEPITRRYLPQRKVSAVRDFPPLCGRNAPRVGKDKHVCLEGTSSLDNKTDGQRNLAVDDNSLKKVTATDVKEGKSNIQDEYNCNRKVVDIDQPDSERNAAERLKKLQACELSSEMKKSPENERERYATPPATSNHHQIKLNSKAVVKENNRVETKPLSISRSNHKLKGNFNRLQVSSQRKVILGLMADSECPWRSDKGSSKSKLVVGNSKGKRKKGDSFALPDRSKTDIKITGALNDSEKKPLKKKKGNAVSEGMGELVLWEKDNYLEQPNECDNTLQIVLRSNEFDVNITPSSHSNFTGDENDPNVTRKKVRETLRLFQVICRKLLQEVESKLNERANSKRVDLVASRILKENGKYVNIGKQILGCVPGVEVGDEFQYRVELNIVGLHRPIQGGIDYVRHNGMILATSIVASGAYADELDNSDVLTYTGQGGNVMNNDKNPEDQKLERGNLALMNSSVEKNPVRVIRGSESMDGKCRTYVYDGLYIVESGWDEHGPHGKKIFKFRLRREAGQPELPLREVKKSKKFKTREGICVADISFGKERIPICAVNTIDDEKPPPFNYITSMIYSKFNLVLAEGCDCINGCSDSEKCSCVVKNGGEIPFNHNEAIVQAKPLVYECGPTCKCPSTCHNRVSQLGIKFQLEIFKTNTRGWGVRSLSSIPSGSFICEYIGELLEEKEAELRAGNDEYLFDIGNNYSNSALWDGLSTLMPDAQTSSCDVVKDGGFTIDAAEFGNVGRFINHSCSPNIIAQNVLSDHHDTRMPHIMFFAADNIPPLQELTYDYNYEIDQVFDSDGNIKRKYCYCGSAECTGRMY